MFRSAEKSAVDAAGSGGGVCRRLIGSRVGGASEKKNKKQYKMAVSLFLILATGSYSCLSGDRVKSSHAGVQSADPVMNFSLVTSLAAASHRWYWTSGMSQQICLNHLLLCLSEAEAGVTEVTHPPPGPALPSPPSKQPPGLALSITPGQKGLICDYVSRRRPFIPD